MMIMATYKSHVKIMKNIKRIFVIMHLSTFNYQIQQIELISKSSCDLYIIMYVLDFHIKIVEYLFFFWLPAYVKDGMITGEILSSCTKLRNLFLGLLVLFKI